MNSKLLLIIIGMMLLSIPKINFGQAPNLGTAANFVLFTTVGAVGNTGISQLTGNVGTNSGSTTGFGNVNGVMHNNNGATAQCAADLLIAYNQLNSTVPTFFPVTLAGKRPDTECRGLFNSKSGNTQFRPYTGCTRRFGCSVHFSDKCGVFYKRIIQSLPY